MDSDAGILVSLVLKHMKINVATAKSYMLFAKSMFPKSFPVLFQSYKIERDEKNLDECASCLSDLLKQFPNEALVVQELKYIAHALKADDEHFLKLIFEKLSEDVKYEVMLTVARNSQTAEEQCELMLLFFKRLPTARVLQHVKDIVDALLKVESGPSNTCVLINLFSDALPLILKVAQFEYQLKPHIFAVLQKAVECYVSSMFCSPTTQDEPIRKEVMPSSGSNPEEGWKPLLKLLETVALRYKWTYSELSVVNFAELNPAELLNLLKHKSKILFGLTSEKHQSEESSGYEEAYFCLVITFFYYLHRFGRHIHPNIFCNSVTGPFNYVMVEGITFPQDECDKPVCSDYKKIHNEFVVVSKDASPEKSTILVNDFALALECWFLLHQHQHLMKEFNFLCKNLKLETWPVFLEFYVCALMHERAHKEAIGCLLQIQDNSQNIFCNSKAALQIASCHLYLEHYLEAFRILFDIIMSLSPSSSNSVRSVKTLSKCPDRYLYFMGYNNREMIQYCISLLLKHYRNRVKMDVTGNHLAIGYELVLMQYNLKNECNRLKSCMDAIQKAKFFYFPKFFNYVINVEMLENIADLDTAAGGSVNLLILPSPTLAKDDLKQAFVNQIALCNNNIDNLFIEFIREEHKYLLFPLINND